MGEKLDDILAACMALVAMTQDCPMTEIDKSSGVGRIGITKRSDGSGDFIVGVETRGGAMFVDDAPHGHLAGIGGSIEGAARDWRDRLVRHVRTNVVRHEAYKAWLSERGLLG